MFFKIYRKRDIIKKKAPSFKGHPSTTSDLILMILPPLDSFFLMVCVLFNLNKYWARYYKKHFFKKFYTVLIRAQNSFWEHVYLRLELLRILRHLPLQNLFMKILYVNMDIQKFFYPIKEHLFAMSWLTHYVN